MNVIIPRRLIGSLGALMNFGGSFAPIITGYTLQHTQSMTRAFYVSAGAGVLGAVAFILLVRKQIHGDRDAGAPTTPAQAFI